MTSPERPAPTGGGTTIRFDQDVRAGIAKFCAIDRRKLSDAVNMLVIDGLKARGLWEQGPAQDVAS